MASLIDGIGAISPQLLAGYGQGLAKAEDYKFRDRGRKQTADYRQMQLLEQVRKRLADESNSKLDRDLKEKLAGDEASDREIERMEKVFFDQDALAQASEAGTLPALLARYHALTGRHPFGEEPGPVTPSPRPPVGAPPDGNIGPFMAGEGPATAPVPRIPEVRPSAKTRAEIEGKKAQADLDKANTKAQDLENFIIAATQDAKIREALANADFAAARAIYEKTHKPHIELSRLQLEQMLGNSLVGYRPKELAVRKYGIDTAAGTAAANRESAERRAAADRASHERIAASEHALRLKLQDRGFTHQLKKEKEKTGKWSSADQAAWNLAQKTLTATKTTKLPTGSVTNYMEGGPVREKALEQLYRLYEKNEGTAPANEIFPDFAGLLEKGGGGKGKPSPAASSAKTFAPEQIAFARSRAAGGQRAIDQTVAQMRAAGEPAEAIADFLAAVASVRKPSARPRPKAGVR